MLFGVVATQICCSELSRRKYVVRSCRDANILFGVVRVVTQIFCSELPRRKYVVQTCRDANMLFGVAATQICCSELS